MKIYLLQSKSRAFFAVVQAKDSKTARKLAAPVSSVFGRAEDSTIMNLGENKAKRPMIILQNIDPAL